MLAAAFPNINQRWLAWLAPGLILLFSMGFTPGFAFRAGFVAGVGHYLLSLCWLLSIPMPSRAIAAWLGLSFVLSLFTGAWCWTCSQLASRAGRRSPKPNGQGEFFPLAAAVAWVSIEMVIARVLGGFPWNFLGASQFNLLPLIQIASVTGAYGVSFLVAWTSCAFVMAAAGVSAGDRRVSRVFRLILPPGLALFAAILFGLQQMAQPARTSGELNVALVQPSIPQPAIWDPQEKTNRFFRLIELSRQALAAKPDLLVWPEAALPDLFSRSRFLQDAIASLQREQPVWMVIGASDSRPAKSGKPGEVDRFNSAFLIDPSGEIVGRYHKRHLVMFGEYMPLARRFPVLAKLRGSAGLSTGEHEQSFELKLPNARFPVLICFEDVFPHEVRQRVKQETDFILNLTNDGWFGEGAAQWQQAVSALFRAVENRRPLVRCANNGLTCWIDRHGRIHEYFSGSTNIYQAGWKLVKVPLNGTGEGSSFYNRFGDCFGWSCVALTCALLVWVWFERRLPAAKRIRS